MRQDSFNLTAYRILKILLWLQQEPLTLDMINSRFDTDPLIDKTLSQDSIGLYLNTLKAIGCEITRPTATNGYQYELKYHPFSYELTPEHIGFFQQVLQQLSTLTSQQIGFEDYIHFYQWINTVIENCSNLNKQHLTEEILGITLTMPYKQLATVVADMRQAITKQQVLDVTYLSPTQNAIRKTFLPIRFHHNRGMFYVMGSTADNTDLTMLRLDRVLTYTNSVDASKIAAELNNKYLADKTYIIRLLNALPQHYLAFNENDTVLVDPDNNKHLIVKLESDNPFLLQQHLLKLGFNFQVLYPTTWQNNVLKDLKAMDEVYAA